MIIERLRAGGLADRRKAYNELREFRRKFDKAKTPGERALYKFKMDNVEKWVNELPKEKVLILPRQLQQRHFSSAENFKPKFRARFRRGDFTYVRAKDPKNEALNHQAYKEVAAEDEFKNNPETYKIRSGKF